MRELTWHVLVWRTVAQAADLISKPVMGWYRTGTG